VNSLLLAAVKGTTRSAYTTGLNAYCRFLTLNGVTIAPDTLPPVNEQLLIYFVAHCFKILNIQLGTIKLYLCGIRFHYLTKCRINPLASSDGNPLPGLFLILQAIKKTQIPTNRIRLPITFDILSELCAKLGSTCYSPFFQRTLHTAFVTAFYGFLRCGELVVTNTFDPYSDLCVGDISFHQDGQHRHAVLQLKSSKTDPGRLGVSIMLFANNLPVCPYRALEQYIKLRQVQGALHSDPLLVTDTGSALTRNTFISALRHTLSLTGVEPSLYSGHSFRSGASTSGAKAGLEVYMLKTLGRWSSDAYLRYIKTPLQSLRMAQLAMSK
jgi:hypothetical protein